MFRRPLYTAAVSESSPAGASTLVVVSAVDKDVRPRNSLFHYAIVEGDDEGQFSVDPSTGAVTTVKQLDREKVRIFILIMTIFSKSTFLRTVKAVHIFL